MSFDPEYEKFLQSHIDGSTVFTYRERDFRLKTREQLFEKIEVGEMRVPFLSCLVAYRKRLQHAGYSSLEVSSIDGTAIGEYSGDILFVSHASDAVCLHHADGTVDTEVIAPSIGEFLAGLVRV
ncbi:hypothetical protein FEM03_22310 [Phragmitibacter flavus]|uniref:Uncharacterized protein n=1 Tax=Phragmitibacter flavus TaxID=2576071 RepID=A0A5R8K8A5_9BACT|nr:hypothetical protein [Phragmitibacter flavus]TLD68541.1 hypothetical protein FEM03_22310 [Phragmitibacter flavus]